jgi:predicted TIM-barrel fold metal-dependent hydrolase
MQAHRPTRRDFLQASAIAAAGSLAALSLTQWSHAQQTAATTNSSERIIDIHQHTNYHGRTDAALLHHQLKMGVTQTVLLPSGSPVDSPSTLKGKANGLYAGAGGIDTVVPIAKAHPTEYFYFANEVPDLPDAPKTIESWLKRGARGIGEQKFNLPCDSDQMQALYAVAQEYQVPILMHFQYETFNTGFDRLGQMLKKWPKVTFIGHALMFWSNIDRSADQKVSYPKGKVTPGGLTDRYLSDYPNLYADMSGYSGLNALIRDEEHARAFIERHQDQMMFGSDCADPAGAGPTCSGASMIAAIRRLSPSPQVARKLLYENADALLKL